MTTSTYAMFGGRSIRLVRRAMHHNGMKFPSKGHHQLRVGRHSVPGQHYLLTTVTANRAPHFLDIELARLAARLISDEKLWHPSRCLCWVVMPDHWHGLIQLGKETTLAKTMQRFKGILARQANLLQDLNGPLWARGFQDHALRKTEDVDTVARYIIANPLRAGLVTDVMDYPYWNAEFMKGDPSP